MRILFKQILIQDSRSTFYGKKIDLLAENGCWVEIAPSIQVEADQVIAGVDLQWFPTVVDLRVHNTLPGGEHKEDWSSLKSAAWKGGVLDFLLLPTGDPVPQQPEAIHYIAEKLAGSGVTCFPAAPLTLGNKAENFSDLMDLHEAGASWFSHGADALQDTDLMLKCLQYLQPLPVKVISRPDVKGLSLFGQIHEGLQSTLLGLKGIPALAETMHVKRDLDLLAYVMQHSFGLANSDFSLHFTCISTAESVRLIGEAQQAGLPVTADVAIYSLIFTEDAVSDFDTLKKVNPPLRTENDRLALWKGLKDGVIQAVVSDHHPVEVENKDLEFDLASFGTIGLETLAIAFISEAKQQGIVQVDKYLSHAPGAFLGIELPELQVGEELKGMLLSTASKEYSTADIVSKSKNSIFTGYKFTHQIVGVFTGLTYSYGQ
ncbi:dihydroorotase [Aquirufa sp. HETE-83D]|uniref:Dihydroorotase n=1 Tax=Aquirufa esocilacus TaxID=3096513 RepID=A0ABW6DJI9_9BACT